MTQDNKDIILGIISKHKEEGVTMKELEKELEKELDTSRFTIRKSINLLKKEREIFVLKEKRFHVYYTIDKELKDKFTSMIEKIKLNTNEIEDKFYTSEDEIQHGLITTLEKLDRLNLAEQAQHKFQIEWLDNEHDTKEYTNLCSKILNEASNLKTKNIITSKLRQLLTNTNNFFDKIITARNFIQSSRNNLTSKNRGILKECINELDLDSDKLHNSTNGILTILEEKQNMPNMPEDISYLLPNIEKSIKSFESITDRLSNEISTYQQKNKIKKTTRHPKIQKCIKKISDIQRDSKNIEKYLNDAWKDIFLSEQEQELQTKIMDTENILKKGQKNYVKTISKAEKHWPKKALESFRKHCKT